MRWAIAVAALLAAQRASATTWKPMSVERLAAVAEQVVEARAVEQWCAWSASRAAILTYTRFEVTASLKGEAPRFVVVKQPGGHLGGLRTRVAGVRTFAPGEEAVLFLRPALAGDGTFVVAGLAQGAFHIDRSSGEATVLHDLHDMRQLGQPAAATRRAGRMPLGELEARVRREARR